MLDRRRRRIREGRRLTLRGQLRRCASGPACLHSATSTRRPLNEEGGRQSDGLRPPAGPAQQRSRRDRHRTPWLGRYRRQHRDEFEPHGLCGTRILGHRTILRRRRDGVTRTAPAVTRNHALPRKLTHRGRQRRLDTTSPRDLNAISRRRILRRSAMPSVRTPAKIIPDRLRSICRRPAPRDHLGLRSVLGVRWSSSTASADPGGAGYAIPRRRKLSSSRRPRRPANRSCSPRCFAGRECVARACSSGAL